MLTLLSESYITQSSSKMFRDFFLNYLEFGTPLGSRSKEIFKIRTTRLKHIQKNL